MKHILLTIILVSVILFGMQAQPSIDNPFFEQVDYRGAFNSTDDWTSGWTEFNPQIHVYPAVTDTLGNGVTTTGTPFEITGSMTLDASKVYLLRGWVYIVNGGTLTIPAGTIIRGEKSSQGAILAERGGKLIASGTATNPVIFTSNQSPGARAASDWGGIVLCGKAPTNQNDPQIEGGPRSHFGGSNPADNSGSLTYVRIEFAGYPFQPNKEINGLTFGGVGSGTAIDNIEVSYSGDDSYEWFGGTVNCKHLIAYKGLDDDFDTDFGYSGMVQFGVGLRDPNIADISTSNGFESDNYDPGINASDTTKDAPYTAAIFSNISLFGPLASPSTPHNPQFGRGAHLRRNTMLQIYNTVIAGEVKGLFIQGPTVENAVNGLLKVRNSVMAGCGTWFEVDAADASIPWDIAAERNWYFTPAFENDTLTSVNDLKYTDPFNQSGNPGWMLEVSSPLLTGSYWSPEAVEPVMTSLAVRVYPNPVSDQAVIEFRNENQVPFTFEVYALDGRVVRRADNIRDSRVIFQRGNLPAGIYAYRLSGNHSTASGKLIVR